MINPCPTALKCACADGNPLAGNSSEAPDELLYNGISFQNLIPPLGTQWSATGCIGVVTSTVSQEDADLQAQAQAQACATDSWVNPVNGNPGAVQFPPVPPAQGPHGGGAFAGVTNTPQRGESVCPDETEFFWTCPAGLFFGLTQEIADAKALSYADNQADLRMTCLSAIQSTVCANSPYDTTITATGMDLANPGQTNNWELVGGMLPPGLTFNGGMLVSSSATITGTPTVPGGYEFTISVTGPDGGYVQKLYTLTVQGITNAGGFPAGQVGTAYTYQLAAVGYDDPVFSVAGSSPPLPDGLDMDDNGLITGTPTTQQTVNVTFQVESDDAEDGACFATGTIATIRGFSFRDLVWQAPIITPNAFGGTGTASASGNTASVSATQPSGFFSAVPGCSGEVDSDGLLSYSGPDLECNIHGLVTAMVPFVSDAINGVIIVTVYQDGNSIADFEFTNAYVPGGYDHGFTISATSGSLIKVTAVALWPGGNTPQPPNFFQCAATYTFTP